MDNYLYVDVSFYEKKLKKVIKRLSATNLKFQHNSTGGWVEFTYKGDSYRFDHDIFKAQRNGIDLNHGSDAFSQIVLSLEDLARMVERGIYDLQTFIKQLMLAPPEDN